MAAIGSLLAAGGILAVVNPWAQLSTPDCSAMVAESDAEAGSLARACGSEVEVLAERTPWVTMFAQPDGQTRMTIDAVPTRTQVNGAWESVDVAVRLPAGADADAVDAARGAGTERAGLASVMAVPSIRPLTGAVATSASTTDDGDGPDNVGDGSSDPIDESSDGDEMGIDTSEMLAVEAPVAPLWLNPGGQAGEGLPLGVIERDDDWVKMWFPLALPEPELNGRFVTYELDEGVRLVVAVMSDGTGFRPVIELDSPEAADSFEQALADARDDSSLPGEGVQGCPLHWKARPAPRSAILTG